MPLAVYQQGAFFMVSFVEKLRIFRDYFFLAQESLKATVRLNTGLFEVCSLLSAQK